MIVTHNGYALHFNIEEVPVVGAKAAGVKAINLKDDDFVASAFVANTDSFFILTQRGSLKRMATELIRLQAVQIVVCKSYANSNQNHIVSLWSTSSYF